MFLGFGQTLASYSYKIVLIKKCVSHLTFVHIALAIWEVQLDDVFFNFYGVFWYTFERFGSTRVIKINGHFREYTSNLVKLNL